MNMRNDTRLIWSRSITHRKCTSMCYGHADKIRGNSFAGQLLAGLSFEIIIFIICYIWKVFDSRVFMYFNIGTRFNHLISTINTKVDFAFITVRVLWWHLFVQRLVIKHIIYGTWSILNTERIMFWSHVDTPKLAPNDRSASWRGNM